MTVSPNLPSSYTLELAPADERDPDPAELARIGQQLITVLQRDGWKVTPTYTGQRGGLDLLFQVVNQAIQSIEIEMVAHQTAVDVLAALCTIFGTLLPLVKRLFQVHQSSSAGQKGAGDSLLTVTIIIDRSPVTIRSSDAATDERAWHLAEQFLKDHPAAAITSKSVINVQARIPKRKAVRRR